MDMQLLDNGRNERGLVRHGVDAENAGVSETCGHSEQAVSCHRISTATIQPAAAHTC